MTKTPRIFYALAAVMLLSGCSGADPEARRNGPRSEAGAATRQIDQMMGEQELQMQNQMMHTPGTFF